MHGIVMVAVASAAAAAIHAAVGAAVARAARHRPSRRCLDVAAWGLVCDSARGASGGRRRFRGSSLAASAGHTSRDRNSEPVLRAGTGIVQAQGAPFVTA